MVIGLSIAMAMQVAPASAASLSCSLVAPSAQAIDFTVAGAPGAVIIPGSASIWPSAPLEATRTAGRTQRVVMGDRNGLVLEVGRLERQGRTTALLSRWDGRRATYPVAVGTCQPGTADAPERPPVAFSSRDANISAFNPARWPDDCGLLLDDGRRVRFDYTIAGPGGPVRIESPALWGNRPVTTRWSPGRFGGGSGPSGSERMLNHGGLLVKIIQFNRIGDSAVSAQSGLGICGYSNVVRRPNSQ